MFWAVPLFPEKNPSCPGNILLTQTPEQTASQGPGTSDFISHFLLMDLPVYPDACHFESLMSCFPAAILGQVPGGPGPRNRRPGRVNHLLCTG